MAGATHEWLPHVDHLEVCGMEFVVAGMVVGSVGLRGEQGKSMGKAEPGARLGLCTESGPVGAALRAYVQTTAACLLIVWMGMARRGCCWRGTCPC